MAQFIVTKAQDAVALYEKLFEADTIEEAHALARLDRYNGDGWSDLNETRFFSNMEILEEETAEYVPEPEVTTLSVSPNEHAMILAALRLWSDVVNDGADYITPELLEIATNGDKHFLMDDSAIGELCERINV